MQLFDLIRNKKVLSEGGNVSSQSPGWQGAADQAAEEIDLKIHDRDHMVGQLRELLSAQNESFKAAYGKYIWDPKLLASGQMFSGSSLQFFDVKGVNTQDFMNKLKKTKVGDIDTQIDQDIGDEVTAWLKSIIGKKVGNGTFLGFNSSLSSIWLLDDPQVRIQVDYELGPYQPAQGKEPARPTEWFAYSHSSHYDDMAAGIKGVFHKYINRALTHAQKSTKYVARVLKKGVKISDEPVSDSDYSFAVSSAQGGGMSIKYKPYIDPATGQPMEKDGIPVMQLLDPKDRDYIQNLDQQFQMTYGRKRGASDKNLQGSFVGTLQLMNKSFDPEQNEAVARAFLDILFGPGAQMITKDDPARDRDVKFAAVDAMLLGGGGVKPLNLPNGQALRQEAVKMAMDYADKFNAKRGAAPTTEVAEDAAAEVAAKPDYARQGIKHLYNRLPDGRVSTAEMKNADFLEIAKAIADNGGNLDGLPISLKVDGAGIRFGKDQSGRPFFMTSKVTTPLYQDDVGYFTSFGQQRGQDEETLARTKKYDDALALITGSKFIQTLPSDTIVQAEMMYNPMAQQTDQGLKFVNIPYDPKKLGKQMTLVPFVFKQYSTGDERPDADRIKKRLLAASDSNIKIVSNNLEQKGINVSKIINPILNLDPKDKANKPAFDQAKQALSDAIINNPKLAGKDALGDNMEGVVVNMPNGQMFKVTSQQMKSAMAAKLATPGAKRQGPAKTAVVAVGSFAGHLGHEDLFNATINKAKQIGGDPYLFIGNAVGKDDPIPTDVKVQTWHKLYPQYADNIGAVMQGGSLMQKIKHELINPQPGKPPKYDNIVIMVGEDRKDMPLAGALMKAVNKFPGYEHVKVTLETIPRTRPISFTKLRDVLKNPNATPEQQYAVWAQGFNAQQLGKDWILHLMDISRKGMGITAQPAAPQAAPQPAPVAEVRLFNALVRPSLLESTSSALAHTAKSLENPPKVMQHRARRDMERDQQLKGRDIAKRNEEFNGEYDDEAGMAQSNLRTMARAVDGLLKTIKNNDNLPEWGQEKIAKAEMMLVSVWDYLQSQKELGMDPKVNESRALAGLKQIVAELSSEKLGQYKKAAGAQASAADKAGNTKKADKRFSGIVKATKKQFANDEKGVAEALAVPLGGDPKVFALQNQLIAKGAKIKADGKMGPSTQAAMKQFSTIPSNAVRTANGAPLRTGSGGVVTTRSPALDPKAVARAKAKLTPSQLMWLDNADPTDPAIIARMPEPEPGEVPGRSKLQAPSVNISNDADIMDMIKQHEGVRNKPYKDTKGLWTVGVGHLIGDGRTLPPEWNRTFTDAEIMNLFKKDYQHHMQAAEKIPGFSNLNLNGQAALIDLTFNMGPVWWKKWPNFTKAIQAGNIARAANELKNSQWYSQVGRRAPKIVSLLQSGGQAVAEGMLPKSAFAGSDKHKLGPAAHAKGKQKGPVKKGQFVGGMEESVDEGLGAKLAGLGLAGAMALGAGGAQARVTGQEDPGINRLTGKPNVTQVAPSDVKPAAPAGFNKEYLQSVIDGKHPRPLISKEKAQELLNKMNAVDEAKKKGADGKACWKGYRYAGTENGKDKCVPVGEDVENIMGALIENLIRK